MVFAGEINRTNFQSFNYLWFHNEISTLLNILHSLGDFSKADNFFKSLMKLESACVLNYYLPLTVWSKEIY